MKFAHLRSASGFRLVACLGAAGILHAPVAWGAGEGAAPYLAVVNGSEVKIRTGGSQNHFTFATVRMGQRLIVNREVNGWCKVHIPRWIPVYVHKDYVDTTGSKGRVKAGELNIRVVPERAHEVVGNLSAGSEVEVLGKEGDWLKIVPPPTAFAYVSQRYLVKDREITGGEVSRQLALLTSSTVAVPAHSPAVPSPSGPPEGAATQRYSKAGKGGATTSPSVSKSTAPASSAKGPSPAAASSSVRRADDLAMKITAEEDVLRRDFAPAKTIYQEVLKTSEDQAEIRAAEAGLKKIAEIEGNQQSLAEAHRSVADAARKNQEIDERVRNARFSRPSRGGDSDPFLARGWLSGFGLFSGHPGTHRLMKGSQVLYYLQSEEGKSISLDSYLNKRVGIKGVIRELEPKYGANLIVLSDISVLSDR